ncbi:MAG TPA: M14 family zinc carboxypeptidase [Thermoleophilaceae bacterium]|jgi:protein MpaA
MRRLSLPLLLLLGATATAEAKPPVRTFTIGHSVRGRAILAYRVGDVATAGRSALVVGEIHGNERAGEAVARHLLRTEPPAGVLVWVVPQLNPDGAAAGTRQNARGVDLNRNFGFRWRRLGRPGGVFWSGPRPFSEPESRAARRLILRIRPRLAVWYHQHLRLVDEASGGDPRAARRYARRVGLPARRLPRYPGRATGWENHAVPGGSAFAVELAGGRLAPAGVRRHAMAVLGLSR